MNTRVRRSINSHRVVPHPKLMRAVCDPLFLGVICNRSILLIRFRVTLLDPWSIWVKHLRVHKNWIVTKKKHNEINANWQCQYAFIMVTVASGTALQAADISASDLQDTYIYIYIYIYIYMTSDDSWHLCGQWPLLLAWFTLIPAWISNHVHHKLWDEINYPFINFNGCTVKFRNW